MPDNLTPDPTAEHERLLLACVLQNADTARELLRIVDPFMLADPGRARTWAALRRLLNAATGPVDLIDALAAELGGEAEAPGLVDLHQLKTAVPSAANGGYYADRVRAAYARRELERIAPAELLERGADLSTSDLAGGIEAAASRLRDLAGGAPGGRLLVSVADFADVDQPAPVVWRDPEPNETGGADPVLSVGEVALLASAGGLGKSTLVLELASAAVAAADLGAPFGAACGLRVTPGPVALVSFEDAPSRIAHRLTWMNADLPADLHLWPDPAPLWMAGDGGESRPGAQWDVLWREVREVGARLVVIDPVSAALADVSMTETGPVRAFLRALTAEATAAGAGVLLVAHDTKAARNAVARGEDPGAGVVAGSAAWYDGARGVLALVRDPAGGADRLLECVKANYGRTGWGARLIERTGAGATFRGLKLAARLDRADLGAAKRVPTEADRKCDKAAANGAAVKVDHAGIA